MYQKTSNTKTVFLFGNGLSRADFDIEQLRGKGLLVGCNWAYRDFLFDVVCSTDPIVSSKIKNNWTGDWIRRDNRTHRDNVYWNTHEELICSLPKLRGGMGWDTGRTAVYSIAKKFKPATIYLFGFDMDRTNLYTEADMANRWTELPPGFVDGWNSLLEKVRSEVVRVGPVDAMSDRLDMKHMTYEEFSNEIKLVLNRTYKTMEEAVDAYRKEYEKYTNENT